MRAVVPFDAADPKTRLADVFSPAERRSFAAAMLDDVLDAVAAAGMEPTVLATAALDTDAAVRVDERPLTAAVNEILATSDEAVAVVMADLALATPAACRRLFDAPGDVVLAPGRGGGTNALVARHPEFRVDYHGVSLRDHRRGAHRVGASVFEVDSHRLATDVDERADLAELLLHGEGRAVEWLRDRGITVDASDGRVAVSRRD